MSSPIIAASSSLAGSVGEPASDDEMDWEEIQVPQRTEDGSPQAIDQDFEEPYSLINGQELQTSGPSSGVPVLAPSTGNIEITIKKKKTKDESRRKQAEQVAELRALRLRCHKIHTVALLGNALVRNKWLNDPILHSRLLSLTPMHLQNNFTNITKKRFPEAAKRGRMFETALMRLTQWWYEDFFQVRDYGHIKSRTFDEVQKLLLDPNYDMAEEEGTEVIRSEKSLMKHALMRKGSRDVSSQLFTALCRALDLPTRLVVSLQSVPWQAGVGKPKPSAKKTKGKGKEKASSPVADEDEEEDGEEDDDMEEVSIPDGADKKGKGKMVFPGEGQSLNGASGSGSKGKGKEPAKPIIKLRKSKGGRKVRSRKASPGPPVGGYPPVFWTEVFSRPDGRWMPVDPIRNITNKRKVFEPPAHDRDNRLTYVVAVEEDGYCRDVTARYARDYGSKTSKIQLGGKGRKEWWEGIMSLVTRPYRLARDDVEDEEFEFNKNTEGMPTSVNGFKNHPIYVLEQHLKRDEIIHPLKEIGKFRGESVYPRSNVIPLKTAENWMRTGRRVKEGAQAMKWVKQRAMTINRRRAIEQAKEDGEEMLQGLYAERQTEVYIPDPIVDGEIPKNEFGNIDLYTPSMLPQGAVHIPYKGTAKIARNLGFDYAEAVTSFEFKKGRAFPVLQGIVVAAENEETMLEAYWEYERNAAEKEAAKRRERVIKRWSKLIQGLRIYSRLKEQYAKPVHSTGAGETVQGPGTADSMNLEVVVEQQSQAEPETQAGGYLTEADSIVQPFHLPRFEHGVYQPFTESTSLSLNDNASSKSKLTSMSARGPRAAFGMGTGTAVEKSEVVDKIPLGVPLNGIGNSIGGGGQRKEMHMSEARVRSPRAGNDDKDRDDVFANGAGDEDEEMDMEEMQIVDPTTTATASVGSGMHRGYDEDLDLDGSLVEINGDQSIHSINGREKNGISAAASTGGGGKMPKSMRELAEAHALQASSVKFGGGLGGGDGVDGAGGNGSEEVEDVDLGVDSEASMPKSSLLQMGNGRSSEIGARARGRGRGRGRAGKGGRLARASSANGTSNKRTKGARGKRKRDESDEDEEEAASTDEDNGEVIVLDSDDIDSDAEESLKTRTRRPKSNAKTAPVAAPPKAARKRAPAPAPAPSTRVLRTRKTKTDEERRREVEAEEALREAVGEDED